MAITSQFETCMLASMPSITVGRALESVALIKGLTYALVVHGGVYYALSRLAGTS